MSLQAIGPNLDPLLWAKRPQSPLAFQHLLAGVKEGQTALASIFAQHVSDGVCTEDGKLLCVWNGHQFMKVAP